MRKLLNRAKFISFKNNLRPVFIVGCGHSGTSIMLSLLDNHSAVHAIEFESKVFYKSETQMIDTISKWYKESKSLKKEIIVEKTPTHIHKIGKILTLFPKSKIILMLRDGRDVACSIRERTGDLKKGIERWVLDNSEGSNFWKDPRVKVVKLEDLTEKPDAILLEVCTFIGVKYEPHMIQKQGVEEKLYYTDEISSKKEFEDKEPTLETHMKRRNWQINQGLFSDTNRWKNEFSDEDLEIFNEIAGDYLELYGYGKHEA